MLSKLPNTDLVSIVSRAASLYIVRVGHRAVDTAPQVKVRVVHRTVDTAPVFMLGIYRYRTQATRKQSGIDLGQQLG